jgi:hypothetical protein
MDHTSTEEMTNVIVAVNDVQNGAANQEEYGSLGHSHHIHQESSNSNGLSMHMQHGSIDVNMDSASSNNGSQPHHPAHHEHLQKTRQYYRDMMLGVNDGLVSTLLLVAGVVGGGMDVTAVLLTAVSG